MAELRAQEGIEAPTTSRSCLGAICKLTLFSCCKCMHACMHACGFL